ncbi:uncharacterized protein L969DRAFT_86216 [Mixia osmundae IAM 14324]|uniref:Uncharacterized protein n=1 Tax=Mixia osmundae (strain CBS 9802 / IAM 14324 / JCM 22182 / KY 12970) TaxID=764103 RepID=G7DU51_MIXOS|nr:uncharacterized protein L969DRAFT_86216 [Mixia osmundae IAM 14324]KEI40977.1 hypothetical protein L969DRAFT_86216 [Mixia osmundae IAM 14324]GAA94111.1 hypothetical protein E5Q_00758 [Mixia osmundae IAM 14324]
MAWTANNEHVLTSLVGDDDGEAFVAVAQTKQPSSVCLLSGLPPLSRLLEDAARQAKQAHTRELIRQASATSLDLPQSPVSEVASPKDGQRSRANSESSSVSSKTPAKLRKAQPARKPIQPYEIMRAIEKKDLQLLFEARDASFELLVGKQRSGDTPLLYSLRIGQSHRDISILLVGALSRFINQLDEGPIDRKTRDLLKAVRANLKLAINYSLAVNQTDLISSYLQCIVMSEGDHFLRDTANAVALALRAGKQGRPVAMARRAIQAFATAEFRSLSRTDMISDAEAYLGNSAADLVIMGLWNLVLDHYKAGEALPYYQFSRDDRLFKTFADRIEAAKRDAHYRNKATKLLKSQIEVLLTVMAPRTRNFREKVEQLQEALDGAP